MGETEGSVEMKVPLQMLSGIKHTLQQTVGPTVPS